MAGVDHLTACHGAQSERHNDEFRTSSREREASAVGNRAFQRFVLCVGQQAIGHRVESRRLSLYGVALLEGDDGDADVSDRDSAWQLRRVTFHG